MSQARTLRVTLDIVVDDVDDDLMEELALDCFCTVGDLRQENSALSATEVARVFDGDGLQAASAELFGGSEMYVEFKSSKVTSAEWVIDTQPGESTQ